MSVFSLLLVTVLLAGIPDAPDKCPANPACTLTAQPVRGSIAIDGRLDEADWQTAPVATGFRQFEPDEGATPTHRTEVRILYGSDALYVGTLLYDDAPDRILQTLGRRDELNQADWFIVGIDSYFDRKTAYHFGVNAAGVQLDGLFTHDLDRSWDAVWYSAVRVTEDGWIAEIRIPYSMLRFAEAEVQQWGINFRRIIPRLSETDEWALVPRSELDGGAVAQYGILNGLENLQPRRNVQVTPYTVSRLETEEGDPGKRHTGGTVDVGGDVKIGLSSNVTLDASINPDFGQVESDPAVLNLSAFETFFDERRPFFTEGVQIFEFDLDRGDGLLYTRRIGGTAPIIGATKLSGRTARGLSFGLLGAATGHAADPGRFYGVARLKQQIGDLSNLGGIVTAFDFARNEDEAPRRGLTGGTDWDFRFQENRYQLAGEASFSHRAFPRTNDDAETGFAVLGDFEKIQGIWQFSSGFTVLSGHFNPNDVGRLQRNDYMNLRGGIDYQVNGGAPFGPFRRADVSLFGGHGFTYRERLSVGLGLFLRSDWELRGFQRIEVNVSSDYLFGGYDPYETRGLGPRAQPREISLNAEFQTDSRRTWQLEPNGRAEFFGDGGRTLEVGLEADWNVSPRVSLSAEVEVGGDDGVIAWASSEAFERRDGIWRIGEDSGEPDDETPFRPFDDGGLLDAILDPVEPYDELGRFLRPVFGERDTRTVDLTLRSDVTLSPTLSVQFYGQLFAARGRYRHFAVLQDRDTLVPLPSYPKTHDFAFNSLQTNTVLRWEYRPGSTLFVVWQHSRDGESDLDPFATTAHSPYDQTAVDQFTDTFDLFPANVFLVKLSYKFLR